MQLLLDNEGNLTPIEDFVIVSAETIEFVSKDSLCNRGVIVDGEVLGGDIIDEISKFHHADRICIAYILASKPRKVYCKEVSVRMFMCNYYNFFLTEQLEGKILNVLYFRGVYLCNKYDNVYIKVEGDYLNASTQVDYINSYACKPARL